MSGPEVLLSLLFLAVAVIAARSEPTEPLDWTD